MTSLFKIHDTVLKVSLEAQLLIPEVPLVKSESKLLHELVLCILSSQDKYEVALAMMKELRTQDVLRIPKDKGDFGKIKNGVKTVLQKQVVFTYNNQQYSRRIRFNLKKAKYIAATIENIYLNDLTIKKLLKVDCIQEARKNIINHSFGLGPKQASMFLRNVGHHTEFAILDKHVIEYMRIMGLTSVSENSFSSMSAYQRAEMQLKSYADTYQVNLYYLDLAIWTTMRTLKLYEG